MKGHLPVNADRPMTGMKGPKNAPIIRSLGTQTSSVANVTGILLFRCEWEWVAIAVALSAAVTVM